MENDVIKNPRHYQGRHGLEAIEVHRNFLSEEQMTGYHLGNTLKYLLRWQKKNGLEDLQKAGQHLTWLVEHVAETRQFFDAVDELFGEEEVADDTEV